MAIDLLSLQLNRASLTRAETQKYTTTKISDKEVRSSALAKASESKDVLELSGKSIDSLDSSDGLSRVVSYSNGVFFEKDMPEEVDEDGNYIVSNVKFSKSEMEQCRQVLRTAAESIEAGIGKGLNLDYKNYAQMSISSRIVDIYGENHLSEEQAKVVSQAMKDYNAALVSMEDEVLSGKDYISSGDKYYGKKHILSDGEIDFIKSLNSNTSISKGYATTVQSATNTELIDKITDIFSKLDIKTSLGISNAMSKYEMIMKPMYSSVNGNSSFDASRFISNDISGFRSQISNLVSCMSYKSINYMI